MKTIVGGRPAEGEKTSGGLPSGIQQLIIAASLNEAVRASVIQSPVAAARELQIELSGSEAAILSSVPAAQLINMIENMAAHPNIPRRDFLLESAAAIAAVAATALGVNAQAAQYPATQGIPATRGHDIDVPPIAWSPSLDRAFKDAKSLKKPLLVVFQHSWNFQLTHPPSEAEAEAESILRLGQANLRRAILRYRLIPVKIEDVKIAAGYQTTDFPALLVLAADGTKLGGVVQPKSELEITEALQSAMAAFEKIDK